MYHGHIYAYNTGSSFISRSESARYLTGLFSEDYRRLSIPRTDQTASGQPWSGERLTLGPGLCSIDSCPDHLCWSIPYEGRRAPLSAAYPKDTHNSNESSRYKSHSGQILGGHYPTTPRPCPHVRSTRTIYPLHTQNAPKIQK